MWWNFTVLPIIWTSILDTRIHEICHRGANNEIYMYPCQCVIHVIVSCRRSCIYAMSTFACYTVYTCILCDHYYIIKLYFFLITRKMHWIFKWIAKSSPAERRTHEGVSEERVLYQLSYSAVVCMNCALLYINYDWRAILNFFDLGADPDPKNKRDVYFTFISHGNMHHVVAGVRGSSAIQYSQLLKKHTAFSRSIFSNLSRPLALMRFSSEILERDLWITFSSRDAWNVTVSAGASGFV